MQGTANWSEVLICRVTALLASPPTTISCFSVRVGQVTVGSCHFVNKLSLAFFEAHINLLTPNDPYIGRIAPLTSKRCILYIFIQQI